MSNYNSLNNSDFLRKTLKLIDEQTGIIGNIKKHIFYLYQNFFIYEAKIKFNEWISGYDISYKYASGIGLDKESALCSCIGEAIERYCAASYVPRDYVINSYKELQGEAINIRKLILYSEAQYTQKDFPYNNPAPENLKIRWVKGYSLTQNESIFVPAYVVGLSVRCLKEERFISEVTSTGLACGYSEEEGILTGLYEVIERDAFNIMWYNCLPMPHVIITENNPDLKEIIENIKSLQGLEVYIINMTTDFQIPSFCTMLLDSKDRIPLAAFGAASNLNPQLAIKKSLLEAIHSFFLLFFTDNYYKKIEEIKVEQIKSFRDHAFFYVHFSKRPLLNFIKDHNNYILDSDIPDLSLENKRENLEFCIKLLKKKGYEVIVIDITSSDISELGIYVKRVIIPEALPLGVSVTCYPGGGRRLYEIPKKLGYRYRKVTERELNSNPHPFP